MSIIFNDMKERKDFFFEGSVPMEKIKLAEKSLVFDLRRII